jgi:hypothetical protein
MSRSATRSRPLLPAVLALVLALAMLGPAGPGLSDLHGKALYGFSSPDAAMAAPERASWMRSEGAGREDDPADGLPAAHAAGPDSVEAAFSPVPQLSPRRAHRAAACARGPPAAIA